MANDDARFECHSLCTIRPMSVTWYGNDASLDIDNIKFILAIDNSLIISQVKSSDAAMYSCRSSGETIAMYKLVVSMPTTTTTTTTTTAIYTKTVDKDEDEPSVSVTAKRADKDEDEPSVSVTAKTANKGEGEPSGSVTSKAEDKDKYEPSDCVTSKIVDKDEPSDSASVITIAAVVAGVTVFSMFAVVFLYLYVSGRSSTSPPANHVASTSDSQQSPTLADQAIEYVSSAITSGPADQVDSTHTSEPPDNVTTGSIHSAATGP